MLANGSAQFRHNSIFRRFYIYCNRESDRGNGSPRQSTNPIASQTMFTSAFLTAVLLPVVVYVARLGSKLGVHRFQLQSCPSQEGCLGLAGVLWKEHHPSQGGKEAHTIPTFDLQTLYEVSLTMAETLKHTMVIYLLPILPPTLAVCNIMPHF